MSNQKLESYIKQFISKLNELINFIKINSERNEIFKNYLKTTSVCKEIELRIYLSGSISDLKGLYLIEYSHYSTVELQAVLYTLIEIGTILEKIEPIYYCEVLKITLKSLKMMLVVHPSEKFHEAIEYFVSSFKISQNLQKGIRNKDEKLLKLVNFHMKILSQGLFKLFDGSNLIGIRSLITEFIGVEMFYFKLTDVHSKVTINNHRKEFRMLIWELLENPKFFQELQMYQLHLEDADHILVFSKVCTDIVQQVITANKKSIYDNCLSNLDYNLLKITIDALAKCFPNNCINNNIDIKNDAWILSRLMLLNYHDSLKFEYMEHIIVSGVFSKSFLTCLICTDIWLLVANELPTTETINYVHFCENLCQATYSQDKLMENKSIQLDYRINGLKHCQSEIEICRSLKNVLLNLSSKNNYYMLIKIMQSFEIYNSYFEQYDKILNMFINYNGNIDCNKFHAVIICILNIVRTQYVTDLRSQVLDKFKLFFIIYKSRMSSTIKLLCLIHFFFENSRGTNTIMKNSIKLLLEDTELFVRLISYKSLNLSNASKIITIPKYECKILNSTKMQTNKLHCCIDYDIHCNRNKINRSISHTLIRNSLNKILRFSTNLQNIPKKELAKHKISIIEIYKTLEKIQSI